VKNVAAEVADSLCESIATKLEGRVLGTFSSKLVFVLVFLFWSFLNIFGFNTNTFCLLFIVGTSMKCLLLA